MTMTVRYDYARVVDVQPLVTRVRVSTPQRECWDETRVDDRGYGNSPLPRLRAGGAVLGAIVGGVIGHQIGHGQRTRCGHRGRCGHRRRGRFAAGAEARLPIAAPPAQ